MQVRRVLAFSVVTLFVSAALPVLAQRNNDASKQPTRSAQEQQDVQALVQTVELALLSDLGIQVPAPGAPPPQTPPTAKPLALGAPDSSQGEVPIKWESNHFVKGQTDTYVPFTLVVDRASLASGAALWIRVVDVEQAAAFATAADDSSCQAARQQTAASGSVTADVRVGQRQLRGCAGRRQVAAGDPAQARTVRGLHRRQGEDRRRTGRKPGEQSEQQSQRSRRRLPPLPEKSVSCVMRSPFPTSVSPI